MGHVGTMGAGGGGGGMRGGACADAVGASSSPAPNPEQKEISSCDARGDQTAVIGWGSRDWGAAADQPSSERAIFENVVRERPKGKQCQPFSTRASFYPI